VLTASEFGEMTLFAGGSVLWRRELGCLPVALAVDRGEGLAAALGDDGRLMAWNLSGEEVWHRDTGVDDVLDVFWLGSVLVVVRRSGDVAGVGRGGEVRWRKGVGRGGEVRWRKGLASECLHAYPVGEYLVLAEPGGVLVVVTAEGEVVERYLARSEDALVASADRRTGRLLLVDVVDGQVSWAGTDGEPLWKYGPPDHVSYLSASADGMVVAAVVARTLVLVEPGKGPRGRTDWAGYLEL
jgi:outer membrane protein assembly factor BamB